MALTEETATEEIAPEETPAEPAPPAPSAGGGAAFNDHKTVGSMFLGLALLFLVVGGVLALLMRGQLTTADGSLLSEREYRSLFTFHGSFLVFLFLVPAWIGVATAVVPLQLGAARLAFPRLQTLALWLTISGGALMVATAFTSGARRVVSGWTLSDPIPLGRAYRGEAVEFMMLGIAVVLTAALLAVVNLMVTIIKLRAPGLTARRLPLFSWSVLVSGAVMLLAVPVLIAALVMLYVDHHYGSQIFAGLTSNRGGNYLMWTRLFWFGAYPLLWALLIPALGLVCEVIPVFARRPIADRVRVMGPLSAVGLLALFGWGSEVRNLPRSRVFFAIAALVVLLPAAMVLLNCLATLRKGAEEQGVQEVRRRLLHTPMLHVLGLVSVVGVGLAASVVSAVDAGRSSHGNYWQVGQQHLLFFAPATIGIVAAVHFWGPKLWGRGLSQGLGRLEVLLIAGGAHLAFLPALVLGLQDMPIHTDEYSTDDGWEIANMIMSAGSAVLTLGVLVFVLNLVVSVVLRRGRRAPEDPWGGHTLEWTAPTPLPRHNFDRLPEVRSATPALDLRLAGAGGPDPAGETP